MPQVVVWTLPMSVLMGTLLALSQLSGTNEIVAMRAGGVSFYRLAAPALIAGALVSLVTLGLNEMVVPAANATANRVMVEEIRGGELPRITKNVMLKDFANDRLSRFLYAADFDQATKTMSDVAMLEWPGDGAVRQTTAEKLVWEDDGWYFANGTVYVFHGKPGSPAAQVSQLSFHGGKQRVPLKARPEDIAKMQKNPDSMSLTELRTQLALLSPGDERRREFAVQYHLKWSIPAASLVFAWVGAPLGVQHHRRATSVGFGLSIIVIFAYYIVLTLGTAMGQGGTLPPMFAAWLANMLLFVVGVYLVAKARK
jgi:lipopolysaccharide export system permease protein